MTRLDPDRVRARFPRIHETCLQYNLDITADLIPVRPAAHYSMGGVAIDLDGRTALAGLYAAGEVACNGVHGANRLASNSLLEGLVYGARAGIAMREDAGAISPPKQGKASAASSRKAAAAAAAPAGANSPAVEEFIREVREAMWKGAGIVRSGDVLQLAALAAQRLREQEARRAGNVKRRGVELDELHVP